MSDDPSPEAWTDTAGGTGGGSDNLRRRGCQRPSRGGRVAASAGQEGLDLHAFIAESEKSRASITGSASLVWPDDHGKTLGLTLLLIERFAENRDYMAQFGHRYFCSGNKIMAGVQAVTGQVIIPFVRDYKEYVIYRGSTAAKLRQHARILGLTYSQPDPEPSRQTHASYDMKCTLCDAAGSVKPPDLLGFGCEAVGRLTFLIPGA
jgi:hypothetical protein